MRDQSRRKVHYPISVAPMMDKTDRHFRYLMRLMSQKTLLYTEMITMQALLHGNKMQLLEYSPIENPLVLQLGGDDPKKLAICAKMAEDYGYAEVNLNIGCPSPRVQSGNFGACLMMNPELVADCVSEMRVATNLPVTVKHRIGVDHLDRYEDMCRFVDIVSQAGCDAFSVHARKAWLSGLSPKENREIPPLRYEEVYALKKEFPHLIIEINGGIKTWDEIDLHLKNVDAVMLGRQAYDMPWLFATADEKLFGQPKNHLRFGHDGIEQSPNFDLDEVYFEDQVIDQIADYLDNLIAQGIRSSVLSKHLLHLLVGLPGNKKWRRALSENLHHANGEFLKKTWKDCLLFAKQHEISKNQGN
jgi:tRNA-dihydrouridine synthase A